MRRRVVVLALGLCAFGVFLTRGAGPGPAPTPGDSRPRPTNAPPPLTAPSMPSLDARDPFRFAEEDSAPPRGPAPGVPVAVTAAPPAPPGLRLVGLVSRGGRLHAALAAAGDVVVAAPGDEVAGYAVVSVDEEAGVHLRSQDGTTIVLPPPS
ncbi:MAG: hypothetical protein HY317_00425 [Acidobacteria bacterium]|nr:hypothetical protein [Acidobacteriota bacterium]